MPLTSDINKWLSVKPQERWGTGWRRGGVRGRDIRRDRGRGRVCIWGERHRGGSGGGVSGGLGGSN